MRDYILDLELRLNTLSLFRNFSGTGVGASLHWLLDSLKSDDLETKVSAYSAFTGELYENGGNLSYFIRDFITEDENFYLKSKLAGKKLSANVEEALEAELDILQAVSDLSCEDIIKAVGYEGFLPKWDKEDLNIKKVYRDMIDNLKTGGYGIFAKYHSFKPNKGTLIPIENYDSISINQLYGYKLERNKVLANTRALASGGHANNVLLYGDAGTGKSSTIKACANELFDEGVRLIQFNKKQLEQIPEIIEYLHDNPLKFIFFIDDLSFGQNDDDFCYLKGLLEGGTTSCSDNIAVYVTSNRRHLISESLDARTGNELHVNDTLQETMSLSARFGLTVTFSKPQKELYLEIVSQLADEYNIVMDSAELHRKAEAFAIRSNGRSPRTAKQFVQQLTQETV